MIGSHVGNQLTDYTLHTEPLIRAADGLSIVASGRGYNPRRNTVWTRTSPYRNSCHALLMNSDAIDLKPLENNVSPSLSQRRQGRL